MNRGKRKLLPKGFCVECGHEQPGEEMSLYSVGLCWRHCPYPLPPADLPDWTPEGQSNWHMRTTWGVMVSNGRGKAMDRARSEAGRRKGV